MREWKKHNSNRLRPKGRPMLPEEELHMHVSHLEAKHGYFHAAFAFQTLIVLIERLEFAQLHTSEDDPTNQVVANVLKNIIGVLDKESPGFRVFWERLGKQKNGEGK